MPPINEPLFHWLSSDVVFAIFNSSINRMVFNSFPYEIFPFILFCSFSLWGLFKENVSKMWKKSKKLIFRLNKGKLERFFFCDDEIIFLTHIFYRNFFGNSLSKLQQSRKILCQKYKENWAIKSRWSNFVKLRESTRILRRKLFSCRNDCTFCEEFLKYFEDSPRTEKEFRIKLESRKTGISPSK